MPKDFLGGPGGEKSTATGRGTFFKEAAFAASQNPSSILFGIHLNRALKNSIRHTALETIWM